MKPAYRGVTLLALHCLLVLAIGGKYAWDRNRLPRAWANATPVDPSLPIRGRYVTLQLRVEPGAPSTSWSSARLAAENGRLVANPVPSGGQAIWRRNPDLWVLAEPVAFFIPEHAIDPSRVKRDEELWAEVSVPPNGPPRPLRLAIKKDGVFHALDFH